MKDPKDLPVIDRIAAAETADPEALLGAIGLLQECLSRIPLGPMVGMQDARRMKIRSAMAYLQQQFNDACGFLMGDSL